MKKMAQLVTGAALLLAMTGLLAPVAAQTSCPDTDPYSAISAALAATTGVELRRWEASRDFQIATDAAGSHKLALSSAGISSCAYGKCTRVQALLDLQVAPNKVKVQGFADLLDPIILRERLVSAWKAQVACDQQGGNTKDSCVAETSFPYQAGVAASACGPVQQFSVQSYASGAGRYFVDSSLLPWQIRNKLKYAGFPFNPNLYFTLSAETPYQVGILLPPALIDDDPNKTTSRCLRVSVPDVTGADCGCMGLSGRLVRSQWNASTYVCSINLSSLQIPKLSF